MDVDTEDLLQKPGDEEYPQIVRSIAPYSTYRNFELPKGTDKHYQQQYGDMYFLRLAKLKPSIEKLAEAEWSGYRIGSSTVHRVERVLDVRQGELCWVVGTVYFDMPMKPNILEDISRDHWLAVPPPRLKYTDTQGRDKIMLEDESGRLRLIGLMMSSYVLVTGCVVAVMGTENQNGDFEVVDLKIADLPAHPKSSSGKASGKETKVEDKARKVAITSGLNITGHQGDSLALDLLMEWLLGEAGSPTVQQTASEVCRLIIAGDALGNANPILGDQHTMPLSSSKKAAQQKKYGYDSTAYNPMPTAELDELLVTLLPSLPVTLVPGNLDPANVSLPQQPLHAALFPQSRAYAAAPLTNGPPEASTQKKNATIDVGAFHPATNPLFFTCSDKLFLCNGGQPITDIAKYMEDPPGDCPSLDFMEYTLRWRLVAPTAPDTLWCYPYQSDDPFVIDDGMCPHVYITGNQPSFGTSIIEGTNGQSVRLISVPRFSDTGNIILLDLDSLEVELVNFAIHGLAENEDEEEEEDGDDNNDEDQREHIDAQEKTIQSNKDDTMNGT